MAPVEAGRVTQRERSEATVARLVTAARRLFASHGYEATTLDDVVGAAGVTKGALYHHYSGKQALFRSVYEQEQQRIAEAVRDAYLREADPWKGFYAGCRAFLEVSLDPEVQRITLLDAPAALGWDLMREIEEDYSLVPLERGLEIAITSGRIAPRPVRPLAHLLFGAICEGAMMAARSDDPRRATEDVLSELYRMLDDMTLG
jgi:AcrR family transcriptional regulator